MTDKKKQQILENCNREYFNVLSYENKELGFLRDFFNHVQNEKDWYARDLTESPSFFTSYLEDVTSIISDREPIVGVNTPMFYVGGPMSNTALHDEDSSLASINILIAGHPKVWLIIDHTMRDVLLRKFYEHAKINKIFTNPCPTHLLHKLYMVCPALLDALCFNSVTCTILCAPTLT